MKLVVGLGNPGERYKNTRHNVGFWVLDQLADVHHADRWSERFDGLAAECSIGGERALLLKPQTYMNASGRSVRKAVDFFKLDVADVLVVADDFSLPLGRLRVRSKGSAGGQNGIKDVISHLGTDGVARLRIGIGAPPEYRDPSDHVLSNFSAAERRIIDDAVMDAARAAECWCVRGVAAAMNEFNGRDSTKE